MKHLLCTIAALIFLALASVVSINLSLLKVASNVSKLTTEVQKMSGEAQKVGAEVKSVYDILEPAFGVAP